MPNVYCACFSDRLLSHPRTFFEPSQTRFRLQAISSFMFNNTTDFQIHNSTLYNVAGDVNLQTQNHNPTIQDHRVTFEPPAGSTRGLEDGRTGSHPHSTIQEHEPGFQRLAGPPLGLGEGTRCEWAGVVRNSHHGIPARQVSYSASKILRIIFLILIIRSYRISFTSFRNSLRLRAGPGAIVLQLGSHDMAVWRTYFHV
jgi:hypothetical protein